MRWMLALLPLALSGCELAEEPSATRPVPVPIATNAQWSSPAEAKAAFVDVVRRVEPVSEALCRKRTSGLNCDFKIVIDERRGQPPNAYQSLDKTGRPVITFTSGLIVDAKNRDELAFVMGHEAAHHIRNHLFRREENAAAGAIIFAGLATLTGGSAADVESAQELGAAVGARTYSKDFELEADELGTVIAYRAGFDPLTGAQFFARIPDPGNRFLGTHPPNAARYDIVVQTMVSLGAIRR